jgi:rubrerythrin
MEVAMTMDKYLTTSEKIRTDDLDWEEARRARLTEDERFLLTYFADIEGQTIVYLRDFLHTRAALEPEVIAFLSIWNYEEFFHGRALARLLAECGHPLQEGRISQVRGGARLSERLEALAAAILSKLFPAEFPAVYMAWGAIQEATTLRGYEELLRTTENPVLAELCRRIAKQERRHFAWYFNGARELLAASARARKLTRWLLGMAWTPVGAGVKPPEEVARAICTLFPGATGDELARMIDAKVSDLPGLEGLTLMGDYLRSAVCSPVFSSALSTVDCRLSTLDGL